MSKNKKKKSKFYDSKYFKWGFTAFLVALFGSIAIYMVFHIDEFKGGIASFFQVLTPIINGLVIAYIINPIMRYFEIKCFKKYYDKHGIEIDKKKKKKIRAISLIITLIIVCALLYAFFNSVLPQLISSVETLINNFPVYYNNIIEYGNTLSTKYEIFSDPDLLYFYDKYSLNIEEFLTDNILPNVKVGVKSLSNGVITAVSAVLDLILGLIIAVYLLASKEKYIGMVKKILYSLLDKQKANALMVDLRFADKTFGGFLIGKIVDSIIIGILCFIVLSILKVPFAVLVSVIVGVTNIIPFFGPFLGAAPSAFIILLVDPKKCLVFLIFVVILQQIDGNIIGPAILGNSIGVSSFWIVVSITIFGGFFGVKGMLLGVPVFACIYSFTKKRVNDRLRRRGMTVATLDYANAAFVDEDSKLVSFEKAKQSTEQYGRYIELNPAARNDDEDKISYTETILKAGTFVKDKAVGLGEKIKDLKKPDGETDVKKED